MCKKHKTKYDHAAERLFRVLYAAGITISAVLLIFIFAICAIRYGASEIQGISGLPVVQKEVTPTPAVQKGTSTPSPSPSPSPPTAISPTAAPTALPSPTPRPTSKPTPKPKPSDADLYAIGSDIRYPKNESYLSTYRHGYINSPYGSDVSVYSFYYAEPMNNNKRSIDLPHGTGVTVIAEENGFACVIVDGLDQACWVNAGYVYYA